MNFRDEELLVNDEGEGEDDYDPDEDVRTLKNPALEELSLGMLGTFSCWLLLLVGNPFRLRFHFEKFIFMLYDHHVIRPSSLNIYLCMSV